MEVNIVHLGKPLPMATKDMTNRMQKVLRSICEMMLRHPDVGMWTFNNGTSINVTQWNGHQQIHYDFYNWLEDFIVNTQLDTMEQMCWVIQNKIARRESDVQDFSDDQDFIDDQDINYSTERTQENGL